MKAEVPWTQRRFIGIPFKTPDYSRICFSDGTHFRLNKEDATITCYDSEMHVLEAFPVQSDEIGKFHNLKGRIILPSGMLSCRPTWTGYYAFEHEKLGELSTEWIQFAQKGKEELFELYAISSASTEGILDINLQKTMLALELSVRHKWA